MASTRAGRRAAAAAGRLARKQRSGGWWRVRRGAALWRETTLNEVAPTSRRTGKSHRSERRTKARQRWSRRPVTEAGWRRLDLLRDDDTQRWARGDMTCGRRRAAREQRNKRGCRQGSAAVYFIIFGKF
jgi:hypothetical protein